MHRLLADPRIAGFAGVLGDGVVKAAVDAELTAVRRGAQEAGGVVIGATELVGRVVARLAREEARGLLGVLNASGVLLHTNLGRAPLAPEALRAMVDIAGGYANLEFDLDAGSRGSRYERVTTLLRETTGAEDGIVVNNCAAAILLVLDTYAKGREVIVSRNQLVEIGGGFRLPDVLERSGATLVEVGATNKVYINDFVRALSVRTALLMRSHTSNYRIEGFVADVSPRELAALGMRAGVPTLEDLGSGTLVDLREYGLPHERTIGEVVADGIDLVAFSGDKLLGGPQAGIIVGKRAHIARLRTNPLLRALRVDKATIAALAATLRLYRTRASRESIPLFAMLAADRRSLAERARRVSDRLPAVLDPKTIDVSATTGGGALPQATIPSIAVALRGSAGADRLAARLRAGRPPIVARVENERVVLDLLTIPPDRDDDLVAAVTAASG